MPIIKTEVVDAVNHPAHYISASGIEVIDVMESFDLGMHRSHAIKYLLRAGRKVNELEDLKKARWWLDREIATLEQQME